MRGNACCDWMGMPHRWCIGEWGRHVRDRRLQKSEANLSGDAATRLRRSVRASLWPLAGGRLPHTTPALRPEGQQASWSLPETGASGAGLGANGTACPCICKSPAPSAPSGAVPVVGSDRHSRFSCSSGSSEVSERLECGTLSSGVSSGASHVCSAARCGFKLVNR